MEFWKNMEINACAQTTIVNSTEYNLDGSSLSLAFQDLPDHSTVLYHTVGITKVCGICKYNFLGLQYDYRYLMNFLRFLSQQVISSAFLIWLAFVKLCLVSIHGLLWVRTKDSEKFIKIIKADMHAPPAAVFVCVCVHNKE